MRVRHTKVQFNVRYTQIPTDCRGFLVSAAMMTMEAENPTQELIANVWFPELNSIMMVSFEDLALCGVVETDSVVPPCEPWT